MAKKVLIVLILNALTNFYSRASEVKFLLPFYPDLRCSNTITIDKLDLFYFSNFQKNDTLFLFYSNGNLYKKIDLSFVKERTKSIDYLFLISVNEYIVSKNGFLIHFKDNTVLREINSTKLINDLKNGERYEFHKMFLNKREKENFIYISPQWYSNKEYTFNEFVELAQTNYYEYISIFNKNNQQSPLFFEINLNTSTVKEIFKEFHKNHMSDYQYKYYYKEHTSFFQKDKAFITSLFNDSLWVYDLKMNTYNAIRIESKNVKFSNYPISLACDTVPMNTKGFMPYLDKELKTNTRFSYTYRFKDRTYIMCLLPLNEQEGDDLILDYGFEEKWILVYNDNLELVEEIHLEKGKYRPLLWITENNVFISTHNPNSPDYNPNIYTVELLK